MKAKAAIHGLQAQLDKKINNALEKEVLDVVRRAESDAADKVVYSMETSGYYRRRGDGSRSGYGDGIGDPFNMVIEGGQAKNGRMSVINQTEPNPYLNGINGDRATMDKSLVYLVEYGHPQSGDSGYDYWPHPKARPFIAATKEKLKGSGDCVSALKVGLKRQGVKVK